MVTYLPISSPFVRFARRYVDEAFGVAAGYNFFIFVSWFTGVPCLFHRFDLVADYYSAFQGSLSAGDSRAELCRLSLRSVGFLSSLSLII